jgi:hypothetical protein
VHAKKRGFVNCQKTGESGLPGLANSQSHDNIPKMNYNNPLRHEAGQFGEASMQEHTKGGQLQRFDQYRASKTVLFWACAGSVILATVVGFSWGGWVTGGSARAMAEKSAAQARQEMIAGVCVDRFMAAPDAGNQLTALQAMTSAYAQGKAVSDGGWAVIPVSSSAEPTKPVSITDQREAAELCAADLAQREAPTPGKAEVIDHEATVAQ